ncbi:MAG TPA: ATP-binding protein [Candidatus Polarisedimenticolia bacterium]|nr:ATP-binding protein [Candidatus Polarisedimenticolia bacterium]
MTPAFLRSYAGQIKIFLVLLVLFLAIAIWFDFHLLVVARNAIQEEAGLRLGVEADLLRAELERDRMLTGAPAPSTGALPPTTEMAAPSTGTPGGDAAAPFVPPAFLERLARLHDLRRVDLLSSDGKVMTSSDTAGIGGLDPFLLAHEGRERRRLLSGLTSITPLERAGRSSFATLAAYRPIRDRDFRTLGFIRLEREVPALASLDLDLRTIAMLQAGGLLSVLTLVLLFARWLLRPYRRLQAAAGLATAAVPADGLDDAEALVGAVQGVLEKMRAQERELHSLKGLETGGAVASGLPGERLISGMSSAALVFDRGGRLVTLNAAASRLLDLGAPAPGREAADLLGAHAPLLDLLQGTLQRGEARSREVVTLRGRDGRPVHVGVMLSPIRGGTGDPDASGVDGVVCLLTDLTEIRALRERARLRDNLAILGEMSAGIAHEFRNALAVIQGHARLQSRAAAADPARGHAEAIERETARLLRIVGDFLRYARPITPDLQEVDLARLVAETADDFRSDPDHARVRIAVEGVFPRLFADETLLKQALQNLVLNAFEATLDEPKGDTRTILVRGREEAGERPLVRIEVEDDGPGVPAEARGHIFTPFYTTKDEGTGLGLPLVQKVAALHDGTVEALPRPGGGTRMVLLLPRRPAPAIPIDLVA